MSTTKDKENAEKYGTVTDLSTGKTTPLRAGRPPGLTPDVHRRIVSLFEKEASISSVAAASKVPLSTLNRWLHKGRNGHPTYEAFALDCDAARNLHKSRWMENLEGIAMEGGAPGVRATLALLARQFPDEWGDRDTVALDEHKNKKSAADRLAALPPEKQAKARELIKLLGEGKDD